MKTVREVAAEGGFKSFYGDLAPTLAAVVPMGRPRMRRSIWAGIRRATRPVARPPSYVHLWLVGAFAGCTPKRSPTRWTSLGDDCRSGALADEVAQGGWMAAARGIVRRENLGSLFAGIGATYLKSVPSVLDHHGARIDEPVAKQNKRRHEAKVVARTTSMVTVYVQYGG